MKRTITNSIVACLFVICLIVLLNQRDDLKTYREQVETLRGQNISLKRERDSLRINIHELEDSVLHYSELVKETNIKIDQLRAQRDEKISFIVDLPLDKSIEFLSNYLSKDGSL